MIRKEMTLKDGSKYIVGFKEVGSHKEGIECHILKKGLFGYKSLYHKFYSKGIVTDYQELALWTILDYQNDVGQKEQIQKESWDFSNVN